MFFFKVEGHMPKLSSFGRGKTIRPKKSLTSLLHAALQFENSFDSVFLIDHAWTYEVNYARAQLKTVPGLADRMASLMAITSKAVHLLTVEQFSFKQR